MAQQATDLNGVFRYIDSHAQHATELLSRLARQPSISAQNLGLPEMARLCVQVFEEYGLPARLLPGHGGPPAVYAEGPQVRGRPTVLLYAHYDVQPVDPLDLWDSPPFEPAVRDGKLFGRGVSDNKGDIAVRLEALDALRHVTGRFPLNVKFFLEGEEESGSPHLPPVLKENADLLRSDVVFLEAGAMDRTGRPKITLGVKGILYIELEAHGPSHDAHSSLAAVIQSPAWRLLWALASLKGPDGRIRIPGFYDAVRPWRKGELEALKTMPQDDAVLREMFGLTGLLGGVTGLQALKQLTGEPTCNICGFHSGYDGPGTKTVLPAVARAKVDFRLVPEQRSADIAEKLRAHLQREGFGDISVRVLGDTMQPVRGDADNPTVTLVAATAKEFYNAEPIIIPNSAGSIGMSVFAEVLKVPVLLAPGGPGYWGSSVHSPNEHVRLDDLVGAIKFSAVLLEKLGAEAPRA